MKKTDYILVGQGIAGSLLAYRLEKAGADYVVIDRGHEKSASHVAAGLMNPVTGKLLVKTWMADDLLPAAFRLYKELEDYLHVSILQPKKIIRLLTKPKEQNQWQLRLSMDEYSHYLSEIHPVESFQIPGINIQHPVGIITGGGATDISGLITHFRDRIKQKGALIESPFDRKQLSHTKDGVQYQSISAKGIIFCEGAGGMQNPLMNHIPFEPAKGEAITIHLPGFKEENIIKSGGLFVVPLGKERYWAGSTYDWDFKDDEPTAIQKNSIINRLQKIINMPFDIISHRAAIRPSVKDRRPILGSLPAGKNIYVFNGLGTKGTTLAPYFSAMLAEHLINGYPLLPEVNVERFNTV